MRSVFYCAALAAVACGATVASADVDISVALRGEIAPGVYGRVDIGGRPPPPLVYAQPVVIEPAAAVVEAEPVYLHVPPEHARAWRLHCHEYHACNRRVYFVRSEEYEPGYVRGRDRAFARHEAHERLEQERYLERERHEAHERHEDHERHEGHERHEDHGRNEDHGRHEGHERHEDHERADDHDHR